MGNLDRTDTQSHCGFLCCSTGALPSCPGKIFNEQQMLFPLPLLVSNELRHNSKIKTNFTKNILGKRLSAGLIPRRPHRSTQLPTIRATNNQILSPYEALAA